MTPAAQKNIHDLLGPRGYLDQPEDLTLYEYDGSVDKARPELVVFPQSAEDVAAIVRNFQPIRHPDRRPWCRHRVKRRRNSTRGRNRDFLRPHESRAKDRPGKRARRAGAWRGESRDHAGGGTAGIFLRSRSFQPEGLHHRRQCRGECRRSAHAGVRRHHESCDGHAGGAAGRKHDRNWRLCAGPARLRSHRAADGLRRHAGAGDQDHRAADAPAGSW